jgi:DNA-binding MarR family transcriptional regulator
MPNNSMPTIANLRFMTSVGDQTQAAVPVTGDALADAGRAATGEELPAACAAADGDAFLSAFDTLAQAIRRARGANAQPSDDLLTFSQYALLQSLDGGATARVSDLAGVAGISPSTATRILDALERRAIVRRHRSPEDRRGVTVTLTDHGRRTLDRQVAWMRGRQRAFYEQLPDGERELVADLLVRLASLIDELAAGPDA